MSRALVDLIRSSNDVMEQAMTDLEKLEYIHSTLQDMGHIFGIEDDMLTVSLKHVEDLREPHLQEQSREKTTNR